MAYSESRIVIGGLAHVPVLIFIANFIKGKFGIKIEETKDTVVKGEPTTLSLRKMLDVFLDFRVETIRRRTGFLLKKAEERDHIVKGLLLALGVLDEIINLIRSAKDTVSDR